METLNITRADVIHSADDRLFGLSLSAAPRVVFKNVILNHLSVQVLCCRICGVELKPSHQSRIFDSVSSILLLPLSEIDTLRVMQMAGQSHNNVTIVMHGEGEDAPRCFRCTDIPTFNKAFDFIVIVGALIETKATLIMTLVYILVNILYHINVVAGFNVNVAIEFLSQIRVIWHNPTIVQVHCTKTSSFFHSPVWHVTPTIFWVRTFANNFSFSIICLRKIL